MTNLSKSNIGISLLGTLRKNKAYIPKEVQPSKEREIFSTIFGFRENVTIRQYVPKRNKAVIILSSTHHYTRHSSICKSCEVKNMPQATTHKVHKIPKRTNFRFSFFFFQNKVLREFSNFQRCHGTSEPPRKNYIFSPLKKKYYSKVIVLQNPLYKNMSACS